MDARRTRSISLRLIVFISAIAAAFATPAVAQFVVEYDPPEPGTYTLPPIKTAGDGRVLDSDGEAHQLLDLMRGKITILSFIYTRCADPRACPFASGVLYHIHGASKKDPVLAENLQLVTFSFDPDHDTPKVMADYGTAFRSGDQGAPWHFLTTSGVEDLNPILDIYGQRVDRREDAESALGPLYHLVRVYLIDRQAKVRNIYSFGLLDPRLLIADVRTLLIEEGSRASSE